MTLAATYLGANGWLLDFAGLRVLVDPWLQGQLNFPPGPWFFQGTLGTEQPVPERLDLLLLTQGLPDHAHPDTLRLLSRDLPVVGSKAAGRIVQDLGFQCVSTLSPGECVTQHGLSIQATAGAPVPTVENGYLLEHPSGKLYLEPHGFLDPTIPAQKLDAVITPMVDLGLPLLGAFVKGLSVLPQLMERFQPDTVLASTSGGDVRFQGALSSILQMQGTVVESGQRLPEGTRCIDSQPGECYLLSRD